MACRRLTPSLTAITAACAALILSSGAAQASSLAPTTEVEDVRAALGICRGQITAIEAFRHPERGGIFTRIQITPLEAIKGTFPASFTVIQRGGVIDGEGESTGLAAAFAVGDERLFYVVKRPDGSLELLRGFAGAERVGAAVARKRFATAQKLRRLRQLASEQGTGPSTPVSGTDFSGSTGTQQANSGSPSNNTGLLVDGAGIPARFVAPDRGEAVGYLVDVQALPTGITQEQALTAVSQALAAWSAVTGLTFRFDGLQNFGMSAANVSTSDERLRIQLHDLHGEISSGSVLGIGGRSFTNVSSDFSTTGGGGGQVNGLEFHKTTRGYVVLEHTATSMQTLATFAEVLCHEVGHALGMGHSSENPSEADTTLKQAVMYFQAHADGRGATLGSYDGPVVQKIHPPADTPPYSYDRIMAMVTAPTPITTVAGINELQLFGCDRQTDSALLTLITTGPGNNLAGTITFTGSTLKIAQGGYFSDSSVDPASSSFFAMKWVRFSDGVNASPWTRVRVTSIHADSAPSGAEDGLPDNWMIDHFGTDIPSAGALSRATDDKDGDGVSNLGEFLAGTSPVDASSRLKVDDVLALGGGTASLTWTAQRYQLYLVESSTDLISWTRFGNPVVGPDLIVSLVSSPVTIQTPRTFYRVRFAP